MALQLRAKIRLPNDAYRCRYRCHRRIEAGPSPPPRLLYSPQHRHIVVISVDLAAVTQAITTPGYYCPMTIAR